MTLATARPPRSHSTSTDRLRAILDLHFHPRHGSAYWLRRQAALGWDVHDRVRSIADLWQLGPMPLDHLRTTTVRDFIPKALHGRLDRFVTAETAGTSGRPCATAYRDDEFAAAFVSPFVRVAAATGFPIGRPWLFVGPSGPHLIGKAVRELARRTGSMDPFTVDFDPRWAKRLADGSLARGRYLEHVTQQALDVLAREEVGVLFTTPPALAALAERMTDQQRDSLVGVHYGGLSIDPQAVNQFRAAFPNAVHLAGYGNTLFGVVMETADCHRTAMDYFPLENRVVFEVICQDGHEEVRPGERGRVAFHRLEEGCFLPAVIERDEAEWVPPTTEARRLGCRAGGLRDPRPPAASMERLRHGIY
jgi:phenylacetate-coenzyme A ligase PaaK-like adenylate-forming protein